MNESIKSIVFEDLGTVQGIILCLNYINYGDFLAIEESLKGIKVNLILSNKIKPDDYNLIIFRKGKL